MKVSRILQGKSGEVVTVERERPILEVIELLRHHDIGAVIVIEGDASVVGILSERDIVRALAEHETDLASLRAADLMTTDVTHCEPRNDINEIMKLMTEGRFRHVPVLEDGRLVGVVSIGDAVRARIDELERETQALQHYITG